MDGPTGGNGKRGVGKGQKRKMSSFGSEEEDPGDEPARRSKKIGRPPNPRRP